MKLIGQNTNNETGLITFYCQDDNGFYYDMAVRNAFGAYDMTCRIPTMDDATFKRIAGDKLR